MRGRLPADAEHDSALRATGIDVTYETHDGCHCWSDFQAELRSAIAWGPFKPVASRWVNDTVATHGQLWDLGYRFTSHPAEVVRFTRAGQPPADQRRRHAGNAHDDARVDAPIVEAGGCQMGSPGKRSPKR